VRAGRGIRSTSKAATSARGLPSPPRRRRPALAALAVLLIVGGAALAAVLAMRVDERQPVLVVSQDVTAGEKIERPMLAQTSVASDGLSLIPASQADEVIGTYALVTIKEGQLLDTNMLTHAQPWGQGDAVVGVPLTPGRVPPDLRDEDLVRLVRIGDGTNPSYPLATGLVLRTEDTGSDSLSGGGGEVASLLVPTQAVDAVVDAAGNDLLGIALLDRGVSVDRADLRVLAQGTGG
jgi:hypothetical protein